MAKSKKVNQSYLWYVQRDLWAVKVRRTLLLSTCKKGIVDNELTHKMLTLLSIIQL